MTGGENKMIESIKDALRFGGVGTAKDVQMRLANRREYYHLLELAVVMRKAAEAGKIRKSDISSAYKI